MARTANKKLDGIIERVGKEEIEEVVTIILKMQELAELDNILKLGIIINSNMYNILYAKYSLHKADIDELIEYLYPEEN